MEKRMGIASRFLLCSLLLQAPLCDKDEWTIQRNDLLVLNKRLLPIPTEWRETTQQDVSDHTSCPDVHLEAISEKKK